MGRISLWIWPSTVIDSQLEVTKSMVIVRKWGGLGWSDPQQGYSIHHGTVGHSCNGLILEMCPAATAATALST